MQTDLDSLEVPFTVNAERAILGSILLDNDAYSEASIWLKPEDFYLDSNQRIYRRMGELSESNTTIDIVTLQNRMSEGKELESVGGVAYLASLTEGLPRRLSIEPWARIVKDKSLLRQIINIGRSAVLQAADQQDAPLDVVNNIESRLTEITQKSTRTGLDRVDHILASSFPSVDEIFDRPRDITGVATTYSELDQKTCGLQPAELIIIAARPSMGKTALAVNIAQRVATNSDRSVAIFSLEMSKEALLRRMVSTQSMVDLNLIKTGRVPKDEHEGVFQAIDTLSNSKLYIDDTANISLTELRAKSQRLKRSADGLDLIVVDYLQLMAVSPAGSRYRPENRTQEVSALSRGLKALAKELDVPVVALSQLSRANELRSDKRPLLSDLRESGAIEQDADVVAFIHRESYYNRDKNGQEDPATRNKAELNIAKQRNGPTGSLFLVWKPEICSFEDLNMRLLSRDWGEAA